MNNDAKVCAVYEFPNEKDKISIGYLEWMEDNFTEEELDTLIENETEFKIKWPVGIEIGPPLKPKKKLQNCTEWITCVVRMYAYGGEKIHFLNFHFMGINLKSCFLIS